MRHWWSSYQACIKEQVQVQVPVQVPEVQVQVPVQVPKVQVQVPVQVPKVQVQVPVLGVQV